MLFVALLPSAAALLLRVPLSPKMSSSAVLERAPPAPPPAVGDGHGGGGDGDGEGEFLRLLTANEAGAALGDWKGRARIYKMSDSPGIRQRHEACIDVLEQMEVHRKEQQLGSKQLTIGLFDSERMFALSSADVSARTGLVVRWLIVHPQELNDDASTAALRLLHGLHVLADTIELPLDLEPLKQKGLMCTLADGGLLGLDGDITIDQLGL